MPVIRGEKLKAVMKKLCKIKGFEGSTAHYWYSTTYMSDNDVEEELRRMAEDGRRLRDFFKDEKDRCGEPTRAEKQILKILEDEGY